MKITGSKLELVKELTKKSLFVHINYVTDESYTMTLKEYAEINPVIGKCKDNPYIVERYIEGYKYPFRNMRFSIGDNGDYIELPLSYNDNTLKEDDEIDINSILIKVETKAGEDSHLYATGKVVE